MPFRSAYRAAKARGTARRQSLAVPCFTRFTVSGRGPASGQSYPQLPFHGSATAVTATELVGEGQLRGLRCRVACRACAERH